MCDNPVRIKLDEPIHINHYGRNTEHLDVPCGKCPPCKRRKVEEWVFRIEQDAKEATSAFFVTLTYNDKYVPKRPPTYDLTLDYRDIQRFMKRLRRQHQKRGHKTKLKMLAIGEYGSQTYRPHWHLILLNAQSELIAKAWQNFDPYTKKAEALGFVQLGDMQSAGIRYILNYLQKPMYDKIRAKDPHWHGRKEMRHMSQGLGEAYLNTPEVVRHHKDTEQDNTVVALQNGIKIPLPKYYREKLYGPVEKEIVFQKAFKRGIERIEEQIAEHGIDKYKKLHENGILARKIAHNVQYSKTREPNGT